MARISKVTTTIIISSFLDFLTQRSNSSSQNSVLSGIDREESVEFALVV
jgi:hypothetical protein